MSRRFGIGLALLAGLAACGGGDKGGGTGPVAGDLTVSYAQSGSPAGALLLSIIGGTVQSVTGLNGLQVTSASAPGSTNVLVIGSLHNGDIFTMHVPDVSLATSYSVRVSQVADDVTFSLLDPGSYILTVHR